jgi:putative phosphoesterase
VIAVVSDTHLPRGTRALPERCVALLREAAFIVHAGDFTAASLLDELEELAPVAAVHGNMDQPEVRRRLPERAVAEVLGIRIGVVHDAGPASGRHRRLVDLFPACDVVVYGHTHVPEVTRHGGVWIVNPGSPTERRRSPRHTMAVIRDGTPELAEVGGRAAG